MRRIAPLLLAFALTALDPASGAAAGGDVLYKFVDERGVVHLSNRPGDPRFHEAGRLTHTRGMRLAKRRARSSAPARAPRSSAFDGLIARTARAHGLSPALVKAVVAAESNFDPVAVSHKGAMGLMQLMPDTAAALGVRQPFASEENVSGGTRYLRAMLDRFGDVRRALAAYNAGPGNVERYQGIPPFPETVEYVRRVLTYYRAYDGDFPR